MRVEGANNPQAVSMTNNSNHNQTRTAGNKTQSPGSRTRQYIRDNLLSNNVSDQVEEELKGEIERLNKAIKTFDRKLEFNLHQDTDRYFVQVIDIIDDEIIREIPPEQVLDLVAKIDQMIGLIIDEKI